MPAQILEGSVARMGDLTRFVGSPIMWGDKEVVMVGDVLGREADRLGLTGCQKWLFLRNPKRGCPARDFVLDYRSRVRVGKLDDVSPDGAIGGRLLQAGGRPLEIATRYIEKWREEMILADQDRGYRQ